MFLHRLLRTDGCCIFLLKSCFVGLHSLMELKKHACTTTPVSFMDWLGFVLIYWSVLVSVTDSGKVENLCMKNCIYRGMAFVACCHETAWLTA